MQRHRMLAVAAGLVLLGIAGGRTSAQNEAPFTLRYPPDGATVREKVAIKVPLASIPEGGYVAYYIDGDFRGAMTPSDEEREAIRKAAVAAKQPQYYTYIWDTKAPVKVKFSTKEEAPKDGEHEIMVRLYTPGTGGGSLLKETSSVKVNLANKYPSDNLGPITLRYKFTDGSVRKYDRNGATAIVAGLTQGAGGTSDQELVAQKSEVLQAVEDKYPTGNAMVRSKLNTLSIRQDGQETMYPGEQLPGSLYQELDPFGHVRYQNRNVSFDQFAQLGIPVTATLEMPVLPRQPVAVGDKWETDGVSLEIPGTAPDKQPRVKVTNTFEAIEWEGGYPAAKIHQHYEGTANKLRSIVVGAIEVDNPTIKFDQDVYVAFRSGTLVKVVRTVEVVGKTFSQVGASAGAPGGMAGGPAMGAGPMGGMGAMMGAGGPYGGGQGRGMMGPPGYGGRGPGGPGMMPPGGMNMGAMMGRGGGPYGGGQGRGMMMPGGRGGRGGMAVGEQGMGGGAPMLGAPGMMGGGAPFAGGMGGPQGQAATQITLKSTTTTELKPAQTASK